MFIIDDALLAPLKFVVWLGKKVDDVMEQEFSGEDCIKEKLMELQLQFELDEISQEDYEKKEMELLARLESIRKSGQEG